MNDRGDRYWTRRSVLRGIGASGFALGSLSWVSTTGQAATDQVLTGVTSRPPENIQYNLFGPSRPEWSDRLIYEPLAKFHHGRREFIPVAITDWAVDGDQMALRLQDGLRWHDGDRVTSQDLVTQLRLAKTISDELWEYAVDIEQLDDRTVLLRFDDAYNPSILETLVFEERRLFAKHDRYQEYLEVLETDGQSAAREALNSFELRDPARIPASGPFAVAELDDQRILLEANPEYPNDAVAVDAYEFLYAAGTEAIQQHLLEDRLDVAPRVSAAPDALKDFPDAVREILMPTNWGLSLWPNHDKAPVDDRAVRRAIAYVLDRSAIAAATRERTREPVTAPTGLPTAVASEWVNSSQVEAYAGAATETAATVLSDAGYTRDGGTWTNPDGNPIEFDVQVPDGWTDWVRATEEIVSQLQAFGFETRMKEVQFADIFDGEFTIATGWWLPPSTRATVPYFAFRTNFGKDLVGLNILNYDKYDGGITVPASDSEQPLEVTPSTELEELAQAVDRSDAKEHVQRLARAFNQDLPLLPIQLRYDQSFVTTDDWEVPPAGSPKYQVKWPADWLVRTGDLRPAGDPAGETTTAAPTTTEPPTPTRTPTSTVTETPTVTDTPTTTESDGLFPGEASPDETSAATEDQQELFGGDDEATNASGPGLGSLAALAGVGGYGLYRAQTRDDE